MKQFRHLARIAILAAVAFLAHDAHATERAQLPASIPVVPGSTIQGVAGTATAVTITIYGTESNSSVEVYKPLGSPAQLPSSVGVIYTAPAPNTALIGKILLTNTTASPVTGVKLFQAGTAAINQITGSLTIPANGQATISGNGVQVLNADGSPVSGGGTSYTASNGLVQIGNDFQIDDPLLVIYGGTGAATLTGYLSGNGTSPFTASATIPATDLSGTLPAARLPAFTGDATSTIGTSALTLATVNGNVGSFGSTSQVGTFTVNGKGLITAAANATITPGTIGAQPLDATLTALAGADWALNSTPRATGPDTMAQQAIAANQFMARASAGDYVVKTITDFGLSQIDDADATAGRSTLGLGTAAVQNIGTSGANVPLLNAGNTWGSTQVFSNTITGSISGNAATVTTNANLTGPVTSVGNATTITPTITAGGPIGSTNSTPVITYNAAGQLTAVTSAAITAASVGADPAGSAAAAQAFSIQRANHTGTQLAATISDFAATVRSTVLTGLSLATNAVISASDTVLSALGKLQAQITFWFDNNHYNAVYHFGFVGDLRETGDGACSTAAPTKVTSATIAFVAADVGKRITLVNGSTSGAMLAGTISAIDSATQVTISGTLCDTNTTARTVRVGSDNTAAATLMMSTINGLTYGGARVTFPRSSTNRYGIPIQLGFLEPVILEGQGRAANQDGGDYTKGGATWLAWWGTDNDGGTPFQGFITWTSSTGASEMSLAGAGLRNISLDCRNGDQNPCAIAVKMVNNVAFTHENVFIQDALVGYHMSVIEPMAATANTGRGVMANVGGRFLDNTYVGTALANLTPGTIAAGSNNQVLSTTPATVEVGSSRAGSYFWMMTHAGYPVLVRCTPPHTGTQLLGCRVSTNAATDNPTLVTGANFVQASPNNGACLLAEGSLTANVNLFSWEMGQFNIGTNWGPACLELHNSDSIRLSQIVINGGSATRTTINRTARAGVRFAGSNLDVRNASRNNTFWDGDAGAGGVESGGLTSTGAALLVAPAGPNFWDGYQFGNAAPAPVTESLAAGTGAIFYWQKPNGGAPPVGLYNQSSATQAVAGTGETILTGSNIRLAPQAFQNGTMLRWEANAVKTAVGAPTRTTRVRVGTTCTLSDGIASSVAVTGTAAIDAGKITYTFRTPTAPSDTATSVGWQTIIHNGVAGLANATNPTALAAPTNFDSLVSGFLCAILTTQSSVAETGLVFSNVRAYVDSSGAQQ